MMTRQVEDRAERGFFETLTGTFKKISFVGSEAHSGTHLPTMNVPHWLAKRDAAFDGVVGLLKDGFAQVPADRRRGIYARLMSLMDLAVKAHEMSGIDSEDTSDDTDDCVGKYFCLLTRILHACFLLLEAHETLGMETDGNNCLFRNAVTSEVLKHAAAACSDSEARLLHSAGELMAESGQLFEKAAGQTMKRLSKLDSNRYEEALEELRGLYRQPVGEGFGLVTA
ncbi:MAG: hypothetical protein JW808_04930 [Victivallales bacterium]|nr:hypothetical protein [Victivallales bacterium]